MLKPCIGKAGYDHVHVEADVFRYAGGSILPRNGEKRQSGSITTLLDIGWRPIFSEKIWTQEPPGITLSSIPAAVLSHAAGAFLVHDLIRLTRHKEKGDGTKEELRGGRLLFTHSRINQSTALIPASITAASTHASNCLTFSSKRVRKSEAVLSCPALSRQLLRGWSTSGDTPWQLSGMRGQMWLLLHWHVVQFTNQCGANRGAVWKGSAEACGEGCLGSFPSPFFRTRDPCCMAG